MPRNLLKFWKIFTIENDSFRAELEQGTRFICLELNYRYSVGLNKKNVLNLEGFMILQNFQKKKIGWSSTILRISCCRLESLNDEFWRVLVFICEKTKFVQFFENFLWDVDFGEISCEAWLNVLDEDNSKLAKLTLRDAILWTCAQRKEISKAILRLHYSATIGPRLTYFPSN